MIRLKRQINKIDSVIDHFEHSITDLEEQVNELKLGIASYYFDKSVESELEEKLNQKFREIDDKYKTQIENVTLGLEKQKQEYEETIKNLLKEEEEELKTLKAEFFKLKEISGDTVTAIEGILETSDFSPVLDANQIGNMNVEELNEFIESVQDACEEVLNLEFESINIDYIKDDFWLVSDSLPLKSEQQLQIARAINILAVMYVLVKISNIVVLGLIGFTGMKLYTNWWKLRPIKGMRDYIYTALQNQDRIEEVFDTTVYDKYKEEKLKLNKNIMDINKNIELMVKRMTQDKELEKEEVENEFNLDLENNLRLIQSEKQSNINKVEEMADRMFEDLRDAFSDVVFELDNLRLDLIEQIEEMNKFEINVQNNNYLLDLSRIHLGKEKEDESLNRFEDLPFGSFLFIYGENKSKMQKLMMYLQVQYASRLRGDLLNLNLLDPIDTGKGLNTCSFKDMGLFYSKPEVDGKIDNLISKFINDSKNILLGYDDIRTYNEEKHSTGSSIYPYTLNLIQNVNIFDDIPKYKQLLKTTQSGIINFVLVSDNLINKTQSSVKDSEVDTEEFLDLINLFPVIFNDEDGGDFEVQINDYYTVETVRTSNGDEILDNLIQNMNKKLQSHLDGLNHVAKSHNINPVEFEHFE